MEEQALAAVVLLDEEGGIPEYIREVVNDRGRLIFPSVDHEQGVMQLKWAKVTSIAGMVCMPIG